MRRAPVLLLLALVACIPQPDAQPGAGRTPTPDPAARAGGTLRVAITPPDGIDPTGAHEPSGMLIARTMCDQLVTLDPVTGAVRPSLAASWTVGNRGRSLFVRLRPDARFSDGTPVTAEDVAATLARLANERFASPSAPLLEMVAGYALTHGDVETDEESLRRQLAGVQIVDTRTVSIGLLEARSDFVRALSHPATSPVPRRRIEADAAAFARVPVCAGPYRLRAEPPPEGPVVLERVDGYTGGNRSLTRGGAGWADEIAFSIHATREAAAAAFRAGRADLAPLPEADRAGQDVTVLPAPQTEFVGMPTTTPPFTDARVRAALSLALDRSRVARVVFRSRRAAASSFLPSFLDPDVPPSCARLSSSSPDLAAARALLQQAGVDLSEVRATFAFNDEFANRAVATEVARAWRAGLGFRVRLDPMPWERFESLVRRPQGPGAIFRFGWAPRYPSVEQVLAPLFTVNAIGRDNWSTYSSRDLNDALREMNEAEDDRERARWARAAHAIVCTDLPMLPLVRTGSPWLVAGGVRAASGTLGDVTTGQPVLRELFLREP